MKVQTFSITTQMGEISPEMIQEWLESIGHGHKAVVEELKPDEHCEVSGCHNPAEYEGWWRAKDFAGLDTGLIQRRKVCDVHKTMLIGA